MREDEGKGLSSLIIPGGIATRHRPGRPGGRRPAVADHPWRDRNPACRQRARRRALALPAKIG
ncbi:hypothetical protein FRACA_910003 [Frankia canadensis]|uniref:Uncharacterized protein n=1 Tax=Frankia canadensis TaxID=1836972 RepID=A0A2I2L2F3_9ACTN|nr:hypothetical protein FRACA_910003 [Frankia canadensis]SOU59381.1 hypothetical protein FRACA_910003 [Frankia canadensis]